MPPQATIIILNWNGQRYLAPCLDAVLAQTFHDFEVILVDNGSTDGSPEMVAQAFPAVHLVTREENLGFAAGNNLALREISNLKSQIPQYVWLLNPDTEVQAGATAALVSALDANSRAGVAGAKLLYPDGSLQQSAFRFPGLLQLTCDLFPLPARFYETSLNGRYPRRLYEGQAPFPVDHPLGAAMMVRAETIAEVGLLDEGFWMYCEEIDWCWRMRQAGWRAYCVPAAQVVHHAGRSTGQVRVASFAALWRSRLRLYDKHYPPSRRRLARWLVRLGMRWQMRLSRVAHRRGRIDNAELTTRLKACQTLLTL